MKRIAALLFCLLTLAASTALAENIRVLMERARITTLLPFRVAGECLLTYAGGEMALRDGFTAVLENRDEKLFLHTDEMTVALGKSCALSQRSYGEWDGLYLMTGANLYPGTLNIQAGKGKMRCVLTLPLEEYLLGVVPFEMGDGPIEALKAQAVCARTYALKHISSSRDYDVYDNSEDQNFGGIPSRTSRAATAVMETAGVVCTYRGKLATCYYGASNGGQTELPGNVWPSREDDGCFAVADDPYDLENPGSLLRRYTLRVSFPRLTNAFKQLLFDHLSGSFRAAYPDLDVDHFAVFSVSGCETAGFIRGGNNRYATQLKLTYTPAVLAPPAEKLPAPDGEEDFSLSGSGDEQQVEKADDGDEALVWRSTGMEETVTLNLFPDVEAALGLSLLARDYELISVTDGGDRFLIESRRYGHGVGMSQNGAMWMAKEYGKTYQEIMAFYFPGAKLETRNTAVKNEVTPGAVFATAVPTPSPTPRPTLIPVLMETGAKAATVTLSSEDSTLNLRMEPSTAGGILTKLFYGQTLNVWESYDDGWVRVTAEGIEGYVKEEYLTYIKK